MKLRTCFLVTRVFKINVLNGLFEETELFLEKEGHQKILTDSRQALMIEDPYTGQKFQEEPSYVIDNCLVSVRFWYDLFGGPAVSIIIVGPFQNVLQLKDKFMPSCIKCFSKGRTYDNREKFTIFEEEFDCPEGLNWFDGYFYAELLAQDLREGRV